MTIGEIYDDLYKMSKDVLSDDAGNVEAVAAAFYFKRLFDEKFSRGQDNIANACLDYGYAILRGLIARGVVAAGLSPNIGLHHKSILNNFNLADDLIEPFRPCVDAMVISMLSRGVELFDASTKKELFSLVNISVKIDGKLQPINYAIEIMIDSLVSSLKNNNMQLVLPDLIAPTMHRYE